MTSAAKKGAKSAPEAQAKAQVIDLPLNWRPRPDSNGRHMD